METRGKRDRENAQTKKRKEKRENGKKLKIDQTFGNPKQVWLLGQLVWAKQASLPWWPGVVRKPYCPGI